MSSDLPVCRDGFDRNHHMVVRRGKYKWYSLLGLVSGVSVKPWKVVYHCTKCDQDFDESMDPEILANHASHY